MRVLGIEGTAWAASASIVDAPTTVISMETAAYLPESGGIHPREAAEHMAEHLPIVVGDVLESVEPETIDAVAFSRGPGLGPCLRIVGTASRTLAQQLSVPLIGVNHMVAHLEVGRLRAGFEDPICLNASGANAHVLGHAGERYRILGETMDTGVGNAIDKFTRQLGWSHPGGPKVEERARDGDYFDLPYVVKGMDFSFSGITSAAIQAVEDGEAVEDVCFSLQETVFAMLTEVSERALALTGREELVIGGGVAQNRRLQEMLETMCRERGASFFVPEGRFLRDNGAMIAMLGAAMAASGQTLEVEDSTIKPDYRPDEVVVTWRRPRDLSATPTVDRGAEATVEREGRFVIKRRVNKPYRHPALDARLRRERTAAEARLTSLARRAGVPTPVIFEIDPDESILKLQYVGSADLRDSLTPARTALFGCHLARLHDAGIVHGDPTIRNARVAPEETAGSEESTGRVYLIDFGLGYHSGHVEDRAMDLHVAGQSIDGTVSDAAPFRRSLVSGYRRGAEDGELDAAAVIERLAEIGQRGRYQSNKDI